jgi:hypothetical protein
MRCLLCLLALCSTLTAADGIKQLITDQDLHLFQWITEAQISPDASRIASLWIVTTNRGVARPLTVYAAR